MDSGIVFSNIISWNTVFIPSQSLLVNLSGHQWALRHSAFSTRHPPVVTTTQTRIVMHVRQYVHTLTCRVHVAPPKWKSIDPVRVRIVCTPAPGMRRIRVRECVRRHAHHLCDLPHIPREHTHTRDYTIEGRLFLINPHPAQ